MEAVAAAHADPSCMGVVAIGDKGVGTTRLIQECADTIEATGRSVLRCWASSASRTVPFATLLQVLQPEVLAPGPHELPEVFRRAREAVAAEERVVLAVDQLHELDDASAAVVDHLLQTGATFLLGSVSAGVPASDAVRSLWTGGRVDRIDVAPLDRAGMETLLHRALGGAVDGEASAELWTASEGNPFILHELVDVATRNGSLAAVDGVWRALGHLAITGRAAEQIERRLRDLDEAATDALEQILVGGWVGLSDLERTASADVLEQLEREGFVSIRTDRRRVEVGIAHPAIAEVVRRRLSPLRARRLALAHVARVEGHGGRRFDDVLAIAQWHLDASGSAPVATLVAAAKVARTTHDFTAVERLAGAAEAEGGGPVASQLLGEALYELGRFDEAEAVLATAMAAADDTDDEALGLVAGTRGTNLFWGLVDLDQARNVLGHAAERVASTSLSRSLQAQAASFTLWAGEPAKAMAELPELDPTDQRARINSALVRTAALAVGGQTGEAIAIADAAFAEHLALEDMSGIAHPGSHMVGKALALIEAGRLAEAWELLRAGYDIAVADRVPVAKMWFSLLLGQAALLQGSPALALRWLREQVVHARMVGHSHPLRLGLAGVAIGSAYVGDPATSAEAVAELRRFSGPAFGYYSVAVARAEAWSLVAAGRIPEARALLLPAAEAGGRTGQLTQEGAGLYDYVRLGGPPADVAARLAELALASDSAMLQACADQAAALAEGDASALSAVVDRFEAIGCLLFAAEAATAAGDLLRREGDQRNANAQANRAATLAAHCEGANTPALLVTTTVVPLTAREREIAYLVARGLPSKDIAERLFLSLRTVQNHLQRIYGKLGVSSRSQVAAALAGVEGQVA